MSIKSQTLYPDSVSDDEVIVPGKRKFRVRPEDALQIACVKLLRERGIPFVVAQPERLNAPPQRRDWFKRLGILGNAGAPELILILPSCVVFCELKVERGVVSPEQKAWGEKICDTDHAYRIIYSIDDLIYIITGF